MPLLLAWLVPGAGHVALRRPAPAAFVALGIWPLFVGGIFLAGFANVSWDRHPWMFGLQALTGLPAVATSLATKGLEPAEMLPHHTVGDLFTCVAGLLNLVAMADVWARASSGDPEQRLARKLAEDEIDAAAARELAAEASASGAAPYASAEPPRG